MSSHKGGRRLGSREIRHPLSFAHAAALSWWPSLPLHGSWTGCQVEYPGTADHVQVHLFLGQGHISARIAVKEKFLSPDSSSRQMQVLCISSDITSPGSRFRIPDSPAQEPPWISFPILPMNPVFLPNLASMASTLRRASDSAPGRDYPGHWFLAGVKSIKSSPKGGYVIIFLIFHHNQVPPSYISFIISL